MDLTPEAVEETPEEIKVIETPDEPEEVEPVAETVVTTTITGTNRDKPFFRKNRKLSDQDYLQMVEDYLKGVYATKKKVAEAYNVDPAMVSDALSVKYVRKRVALQVQRLKDKYNYNK